MSKGEGGRNSSFSEKPVRSRPRRLVDWINPTGTKKVHSLIDKVYKRKNLEIAWEKVKANRGSGGIDGQSLEAFEAQLSQQLDRLHRELKEDSYRPRPVRQHPIEKRDKPGEYRMLGIPTIYDRVCQQALLNRLEPIFEPIFDDASFGYRRGRLRGYQLTRYADDWVVTCKSAAEATGAVDAARRILKQLDVELHPQKTRIVHIQKGFEFLGYKIKRGTRRLRMPARRIRTKAAQGTLYAYPKAKSIRRFMDEVRRRTQRRLCFDTHELIKELNPVLRGGGEYYKRAHVRLLFYCLDRWITHRIWAYHAKRWRNAYWKRLPQKVLYGEYELVNLVSLMPSLASRKPESS